MSDMMERAARVVQPIVDAQDPGMSGASLKHACYGVARAALLAALDPEALDAEALARRAEWAQCANQSDFADEHELWAEIGERGRELAVEATRALIGVLRSEITQGEKS